MAERTDIEADCACPPDIRGKFSENVKSGDVDSGLGSLSKELSSKSLSKELSSQLRGLNLDSGYDDSAKTQSFELNKCSPEHETQPLKPITEDQAQLRREKIKKCFAADTDGDTQLHIAVIRLEILLAKQLILAAPFPELLSLQNRLFQTALHLAVLQGQAELVRLLVVRGCEIETRDVRGNTALHLACQRGYMPSVKALTTPVSVREVMQCGGPTIRRPIPQSPCIKNYAGETCLHIAAQHSNLEVMTYLTSPKFGADPDYPEGLGGRTPLHIAVEAHNIPVIVTLIRDCGADVNARDRSNHTPLQLSAGRCYSDVSKLLLGMGSNPRELEESDSDMEDSDYGGDDDLSL